MLYLLLCFISLFMGLGIQRLFKVTLSPALSITLAPILSLSVCAIMLGWGVKLGYSIKEFYCLAWAVVAGLSLIGMTHPDLRKLKHCGGLLIACLALPSLLMLNYFWFGLANYPGAAVADGWSYVAVAQYIWDYPRGTEGNLIPLFQYATSLNSTRFISSAMLAFLSPLVVTADSQLVVNAYLAWLFFIFSSACAFFALTQKKDKYIYLYLLLVVFSGWYILLLENDNYDHAAFLGFLPIIAGAFTIFNHQRWVWSILLSIVVAAGLYIYPEMSPPLILAITLFFAATMIKNQKIYVVEGILAVVLILLLCLPYWSEFIGFFLKQANQLKLPNASRSCPYFNLSMLIPSRMLLTFWGQRHNLLGNITAVIFTILFFRGLFVFCKQKRFAFLIFIAALIAGASIMIFKYQYSYGAFKFISIAWWLIIFAVVVGIRDILATPRSLYVKAILAFGLFAYVVSGACSIYSLIQKSGFADIAPLRALQSIKEITGNEAILVNVNDDVNNEWAMYFLREYRTQFVRAPRFMAGPSGRRFMARSAYVDPADIHYVLTDSRMSYPYTKLVWAQEPYYLWKSK